MISNSILCLSTISELPRNNKKSVLYLVDILLNLVFLQEVVNSEQLNMLFSGE